MARKLAFITALLLLVAVSFHVGQATAWSKEPTLSRVASLFAMRSVAVRCYEPLEDDAPQMYNAWGYVRKPLWKAQYAAIDGGLCQAALAINDPSVTDRFHRALSVLVIVHESYHLRRWGASGNEAKVECKAIRHWKVGARLLGASEATIEELWPMALALHQEEAGIVDWRTGEKPYFDPTCRVPLIQEQP